MLMLEKNFQLSSKKRINVDPKKLENFSQNHVKFYLKYSSFVFKALKKHLFQKFLHWVPKKEALIWRGVRLNVDFHLVLGNVKPSVYKQEPTC